MADFIFLSSRRVWNLKKSMNFCSQAEVILSSNLKYQCAKFESVFIVILVSLGKHSKISHIGWFKQRILFLSSGAWEVQKFSTSKIGFILRPLLLACYQPPSLCVLAWTLLCAPIGWEEGERGSLWCLLLEVVLSDQSPALIASFNLCCFLRCPHLQIQPHWNLDFSIWILWGHKHLFHNNSKLLIRQ